MVKSVKSIRKMAPDFKEIKIYTPVFKRAVWISVGQLDELLAEESPHKFFNVDTIPGELLLIGHPNTEG